MKQNSAVSSRLARFDRVAVTTALTAIGTKRTSLVAAHMSAFGGKADISNIFSALLLAGNQMHNVAWNRSSGRCNRNDMSKDTLDGRGEHKFCVAGTLSMIPRDQYLLRAAESVIGT